MEISNILICGNFDHFQYLQAKVKFCILDTEDELAKKNAYFKNLKLYNSIEQLPAYFKWAYIPKISLIASNNFYLRQELLEAGISIIDQTPVDVNQIKECARIASYKRIYYIPVIPGVNDNFFEKCIKIIYEEFKKNDILYIDGLFSVQSMYYIFKIIKEGLQTNQKISTTDEYSNSIIKIFSGYISNIPFCIRIYSPNINSEYKFIKYDNQLKLFTDSGCITIDFIQKNILYNGKTIEKTMKNTDFLNESLKKRDRLSINRIIDKNMDINSKDYRSQIQEALNDFSFIQDINKGLLYNKTSSIGKYEVQSCVSKILESNSRLNHNDLDKININREISNIERNYSHISKEYLLKYKETIESYILGKIFIFFKENGIFNEQNVGYSEKNIIYDCFQGKNIKIVKRWLKKLILNDFIEYKDGYFYSTKNLQINNENNFHKLHELWDWKLGTPYSIDYIKENIEKLKELFYGKIDCNTILFPESDTKYATALYKDNIIYRFLNEMIGIQVADYIEKHFDKRCQKTTILEVGAGIGATTDSILEKLKEHNLIHKVNYLYTDISKFFLDIGKEKYKDNAIVRYLRLNIDNLKELESLEDVDIIIASGVLNNSKNLERVIKELLKKIEPNGLMMIIEPIDEPIEILVSQVFMMEEPSDIRNKKNSTFLDLDDWIELINQYGDYELSVFPRKSSSLNMFGQKLFVIRNKER